jgi:hypothetical protein
MRALEAFWFGGDGGKEGRSSVMLRQGDGWE